VHHGLANCAPVYRFGDSDGYSRVEGALMTLAAPERRSLIHLIVAYATERRGAVSKIRLIKFLYLADVHAFQRTQQTLTGYPWRLYHYGPWAIEAQAEISDCATSGVIDQIQ
jgi:Protein of unknown function (DUF4065)